MDQQLSQAGKVALDAFRELSTIEKGNFVALASTVLAAEIAKKVSTASPEQLAEASSKIDEAVKGTEGAPQDIKTASHGFKQVTAPDGTAAIEVKITRANGSEVTCLLSEGARGKWYRDLAAYGENELKGATLLSSDDFKAVVTSLFNAIKGQKVVDRVLQTEDEYLKKAYQIIVTEGVRRDGGFSWAEFDLDSGGAVVGRRVDGFGSVWLDPAARCGCALFVASPAESKKS